VVADGISKDPCPRCGGEVEWWVYNDSHYASNTSGAKCKMCKHEYRLYDYGGKFVDDTREAVA
jgi:hypothetical protein